MSDEEFDAHLDELFSARPGSVAVSLRVAPDLLGRVRRQAARAGVPHQTFIKSILETAVSRLERRRESRAPLRRTSRRR
jgi:predicted DNA binding CopG/RHH family protein